MMCLTVSVLVLLGLFCSPSWSDKFTEECHLCQTVRCASVEGGESGCKARGGTYFPRDPSKFLCRCCDECQCCEICSRVFCVQADETLCKEKKGTYLPRNTDCGSECRCCGQCLIKAGVNEDCSNSGLPLAFFRKCDDGLQCNTATNTCTR